MDIYEKEDVTLTGWSMSHVIVVNGVTLSCSHVLVSDAQMVYGSCIAPSLRTAFECFTYQLAWIEFVLFILSSRL